MPQQDELKPIAIVGGTGNQGPGLALRWARSGRYRVIIGSRRIEKAEKTAAELNDILSKDLTIGMTNQDAAAVAEIVVLTVPYGAHQSTLESIRPQLKGKILVDVTVPLKSPTVSIVHLPPGGSATAEAQTLLGGDVRVVAAFQNVSAVHLRELDRAVDCDVLVCGDDSTAKTEVLALAQAGSMQGIDAGPLANAVVVEGLTAILIGLNRRYKVKGAGIRITEID